MVRANLAARIDSETVPIWLTLSSSALQLFCSTAFFTRSMFVTVRSSPTTCCRARVLASFLSLDCFAKHSGPNPNQTHLQKKPNQSKKTPCVNLDVSAGRERRPAGPVVLVVRVLNADNGELLDELVIERRQLLTRQVVFGLAALPFFFRSSK